MSPDVTYILAAFGSERGRPAASVIVLGVLCFIVIMVLAKLVKSSPDRFYTARATALVILALALAAVWVCYAANPLLWWRLFGG